MTGGSDTFGNQPELGGSFGSSRHYSVRCYLVLFSSVCLLTALVVQSVLVGHIVPLGHPRCSRLSSWLACCDQVPFGPCSRT